MTRVGLHLSINSPPNLPLSNKNNNNNNNNNYNNNHYTYHNNSPLRGNSMILNRNVSTTSNLLPDSPIQSSLILESTDTSRVDPEENYITITKVIIRSNNIVERLQDTIVSNRVIRIINDPKRFLHVSFKPKNIKEWSDKSWKTIMKEYLYNGIEDNGKM